MHYNVRSAFNLFFQALDEINQKRAGLLGQSYDSYYNTTLKVEKEAAKEKMRG